MRLRTGVYGHHTRVCTESWLWEKNPLLHWEIKPASVACWSDALPTELHLLHVAVILLCCNNLSCLAANKWHTCRNSIKCLSQALSITSDLICSETSTVSLNGNNFEWCLLHFTDQWGTSWETDPYHPPKSYPQSFLLRDSDCRVNTSRSYLLGQKHTNFFFIQI